MKKNKKKPLLIILALSAMIILISAFLILNKNNKELLMIDLQALNLNEIKDYAKNNNIILTIKKIYDEKIKKDVLINQSIKPGEIISKNNSLTITISLGPLPLDYYRDNSINELGNVPIIMYHGIMNLTNDETAYTGGNVDKDGYNRTKEAFIRDLEMYYQKSYRMISLKKYLDGEIDTEFGKSPIVLTFDDGSKNNINILGKDKNGNLMIDPNSAVGILEAFKEKYPDFKITATFFLNEGLFFQPKYNNDILKWLVSNGYDIGNHTSGHINLAEANKKTVEENVGTMYKILESIISGQYIPVLSLPFGVPYNKDDPNFPYILNGQIGTFKYQTESTLRVGWEPNYSPFHSSFDKSFIKRVRAWDNEGKDDLEMHFKNLEKTKYISDGNVSTIVITDEDNFNNTITNKKIIKY